MTIPVLRGLREIADRYDGFILDLWGVIHDGVNAYPGVAATLTALRSAGKRIVMLSNSPRRTDSLIVMMEGMAIDRSLFDDVVSSGEAVHAGLAQRTDPWFAALGRHCLHLGPDRDLPIFQGLDLTLVERVADADFIVATGTDRPEETVEDYRPILEAAAARRLPMICANPDLVVISEGIVSLCAGSLARYFEEIGGDVRYRGKPYRAVYETCFERLAVADHRRILAVGDAFHTDVAGAAAAGIDCLFCSGGIHAVELGTSYGMAPDPARVQGLAAAQGGLYPVAAIGGLIW